MKMRENKLEPIEVVAAAHIRGAEDGPALSFYFDLLESNDPANQEAALTGIKRIVTDPSMTHGQLLPTLLRGIAGRFGEEVRGACVVRLGVMALLADMLLAQNEDAA